MVSVCCGVNAFSFHRVILPPAMVLVPVFKDVRAPAMHLPLFKVALIHITIGITVVALPMHKTAFPLT